MRSSAPPSRLRRLLTLPAGEKRLLVEAWWRLLVAALRLRLAPRRTVAHALTEPAPAAPRHRERREAAGTSTTGESAGTSQGTSQESLVSTTCESAGTSQAGTLPQRVALAVSRAAAHHLGAMTCLPRAIALQKMLARRGIRTALRIGVRKESAGSGGSSGGTGTIAAHAWVEVDGVALGEPEAIEERFRPLLPTTPAEGTKL